MKRVLVYPNITYQKDLSKDSYINVLYNLIKHINLIRKDLIFYTILPKHIDIFDEFNNVYQLYLPLPNYPNQMRTHFDSVTLLNLINFTHNDFDLVYTHLPEHTLQLRNLIYNKTHFKIPFLGYCHYFELPENTYYEGNMFDINMLGVLQTSYTGVNSNYIKSLVMKRAKDKFNDKTISELDRILEPHYLGVDMDELTAINNNPERVMVFNQRDNKYTGFDWFLKTMDKLWSRRKDFKVLFALTTVNRPYALNVNFNNEDYVISRISNPIKLRDIEPKLILVDSQQDKICYEYLRALVASLPQFGYVGRHKKFLLIDKISKNVIGFSSIGSDLCIISARDKLIGWTHKQKFKKKKLGCGININVCMSLQPYGMLTTGKLLAMLMCSNEIRDLWKSEYGDPCCYVLTTSLYGKSSQYNRINDYLRFIGYTKGFGTIHIDNKLYKLIDEYLTLTGKNISLTLESKQRIPTNAKLRKIQKTGKLFKKLAPDKHHNLSTLESDFPELKDVGKHYQKRGIYLGFMAENAKEFLTEKIGESELDWYDRPVKDIIDFWKERWFSMRLEKLENELEFNPESYRVENVLKEKVNTPKQSTLF